MSKSKKASRPYKHILLMLSSMARKLPPAPVQYLSRRTLPFRRDMEAAQNGFADEFPLLCAIFGVSIVPQVMILDPQTKQPVPLPRKSGKEFILQKITPPGNHRKIGSGESLLSSVISMAHDVPHAVPHAVSFTAPHAQNYTKDESVPSPYVMVSFDNIETQESLTSFYEKGYPVDAAFIRALGTCLKWYHTLQVLVLENCNMTAELVELLSKYLADSHIITNLTLDENPIPQQNYYLILHANTGLHHLSLAKCEIDDKGAHLIAKELAYRPPPWKESLVSLNLGGNRIGDEGMESIANALRTNRSLREILLPKNSIGDKGAMALATALQKFPLCTEEIKNREKENITELQMKIAAQRRSSTNRKHSASLLKKRKCEKICPPENLEDQTKRKKVVYKYHHPYVWDVRPEGLDLWCIGNFNLEHIDLGYNSVGVMAAKKFVEAIEYQSTLKEEEFKEQSGLSKINLQGNLVPTKCYELDRIDEILSIPLRLKHPPKPRVPKPEIHMRDPWQSCFKSLKKSLCIKSSSGKSLTLETLRNLILQYRKMCTRWVPEVLTEQHKMKLQVSAL